jgi:hypothetical protein
LLPRQPPLIPAKWHDQPLVRWWVCGLLKRERAKDEKEKERRSERGVIYSGAPGNQAFTFPLPDKAGVSGGCVAMATLATEQKCKR